MGVRRYIRAGRACVYAICAAVMTTAVLRAQDAVKPSASTTFDAGAKAVLERNCGGCHANGGHAGGFRMGTLSELMRGGEDGSVVEWGSPEKSMLSRAIHYNDETLQMPPAKKMSDADIAVVDKWIRESSAPLLDAPTSPAAVVTATLPPANGPVAAAKTATPTVTAQNVSMSLSPQMTAEQEVFFETKVRPILIENCYSCHASAGKGGLRLNSRAGVLAGGKDGPVVVPGHPELSSLSTAVHYADPHLQMPPRVGLSADKVAVLDQWIKDGVPWPKEDTGNEAVTTIKDSDRNFWSFKAPVAPAVPQTKSSWAFNDIDRFILAKLDEKGIKPVADADKRTLLRRVTYDLTGLPPTKSETDAFLADKSPKAYEKVVDRLLASKAYGERWGRIWLDVVRYSDTSGGGGDYPIVQASKYRDYVIAAFNADKPYDEFIKEQIAGDLLPAKSEPEHWEHVVATGYVANASRADRAQIEDIVDNVGFAYLGLTVGCARCHDHKFDPIPQSDYYALAGFFESTRWPNPGDDNVREQVDFVFRNPKDAERDDIKSFMAQLKPINGAIAGVVALPGTYDDILPQLEARRMNLYAHAPAWPEMAYAVQDGPVKLAQIQKHGDPKQLGDEVPRGFLQVLGNSKLDPATKGSGRLQLAEWIASDKNPLTARVIVNRVWQGEFGRGLVLTPNNFGTRGMPPANQALLDFLATQFMQQGWSIKTLQREILLSHAYRLSTKSDPIADAIDPDNALVWRHTRVRLDAEEIRDSMLADSGQLDTSPVKPHPFPDQSKWNWEEQNPFTPKLADYENDHRTVYMMIQRSVRHPYMSLFDGADPNLSVEQRSQSLTPLQALYFLDSPFPRSCADKLVEELSATADGKPMSEKARIAAAFEHVLNRPPSPDEERQVQVFLTKAKQSYLPHAKDANVAETRAFSSFVQVLFASNEFMFLE